MNSFVQRRLVLATVVAFVSALVVGLPPASAGPSGPGRAAGPDAWRIREILTSEFGVERPTGVAWDPDRRRLLVTGTVPAGTEVVGVTPDERARGRQVLEGLDSGSTAAFDPRSRRLTLLQDGRRSVVTDAGATSRRWATEQAREAVAAVDAAATTYSPDGTLHVLDAATGTIVSVSPGGKVRRVPVRGLRGGELAGVAYQPVEERLYVADATAEHVYALDADGRVVRTQDLAGAEIDDLQAMAFAPSSDNTDAETDQSLYVADAGTGERLGSIAEVSLEQAVTPVAATVASQAETTAVHDTSAWSPPSPDPSGITFLPGPTAADHRVLVSDGEVEEMPIYADVNLFTSDLHGNLEGRGTTARPAGWSNEPVGLEYDAGEERLFLSDDVSRRVYEVAGPGADGVFGMLEDGTRTSFRTTTFGSTDPEGVAYDSERGEVVISDGIGSEVFRVNPGPNGTFDGIEGDDFVTQFDVERLGLTDPEGVVYDAVRDTLVLVDDRSIWELDNNGSLLNRIDISDADIDKAAAITIAPASDGSGARHYYIAARGVDNDSVPTENDGKLYEIGISLPEVTNRPPTVDAGPDQLADLGESVQLSGAGADDGVPGVGLTYSWSVDSGPGTVTFESPTAASTRTAFSMAGRYTLRLTVSDSQMTGFDLVVVDVYRPGDIRTVQIPVRSSADDAMEGTDSGGDFVSNTRADNELGENETAAGVRYPVLTGLRFAGIPVAAGGEIVSARIQFKVDELSTGDAAITFKGEASDDAAPYVNVGSNISSRPTTAASVQWSPPTWSTRGDAGPAQRTPDLASILQEVVDRPGWQQGNAAAFVVTGTGRRTATSYESAGPPVLVLRFYKTKNQPPVVTAGADQAVTLPAGATLQGSVTDDGRPDPPGRATSTWSKVSGPGTVTFGDTAAPQTTAAFSLPGTYVLRLTATDSVLTASDEVAVTVSPPVNKAPVVDAGADQSVKLPASAALQGSVADDGLPDPPGATTTVWSKVSGPGTVTFADPANPATTASFATPGTYTLRLTADDSGARAFDDLVVTVSEALAVTLRADTEETMAGDLVRLTGLVSGDVTGAPEANSEVEILVGRAPDFGGSSLGTVTTGPDGSFTLEDHPSVISRYVAVAGNLSSNTVQVRVEPRLGARLVSHLVPVGAKTAVVGSVTPSADGQPLRLQRWNGTAWRTVQRQFLPPGESVRYSFTVSRPTSGVYRFRVVAPPYGGRARTVAPSPARGLVLRVYRVEILRVKPAGDEFVKVRNTGAVTVVLDGWRLENRWTGRTVRVTPVRLRPGWFVRIHTGSGRTDLNDLYLGRRRQMWGAHAVAVLRDRWDRVADRYRY